jgi:hypothetical protein
MSEPYPLWTRAGAIHSCLEVAYRLSVLSDSDTAANDIATTPYIGAILEVVLIAQLQLIKDIDALEERQADPP